MAQALIWSKECLDDINEIAKYISRDSLYYANRLVEQVFALGESLQRQPYTGRMVPELAQDHIRERFLYSYRIIYEIFPDEIHVVAVIHGSRLLDKAIENRISEGE